MFQLPKQSTSRCLCPSVEVTSRHEHLVKNIQRGRDPVLLLLRIKIRKKRKTQKRRRRRETKKKAISSPREPKRREKGAADLNGTSRRETTELGLKCKSKLWIYPLAAAPPAPARTHYRSTRRFHRLQILSACCTLLSADVNNKPHTSVSGCLFYLCSFISLLGW